MTSLENLIERLNKQLTDRRQQDLFRELTLPSPYKINLSGNDYFQLRHNPEVIEAGQKP